MPAHAGETLCVPIVDSLRASLAKDASHQQQRRSADELDGFLSSTSSKKILSDKIEFVAASNQSTASPYSDFKQKYKLASPAAASSAEAKKSVFASGSTTPTTPTGVKSPSPVSPTGSGKPKGEELPQPKHVLCPPEKVVVRWKKAKSLSGSVGSGLANMGNTCFLNSTLQCLTHTAPLANYLISGEHRGCRSNGQFCMMCELQYHVAATFNNSGGVIRPNRILSKLKLICASMRAGRQEDAHEFLRYLIEAAHKGLLIGYPTKQLDQFSKETTLINQIFSGYHRSQVQCTQCHGNFNTYDLFMDISIDVKSLPSVTRGLEKFITPELLDRDNAYFCTNCKRKVAARKRFTIHKAPKVLTLQLKRFDYNRGFNGGKINKFIQYPLSLNLQPYMSSRKDPVPYSLYAVLVHEGFSCNSGHYYCYVKAPNGTWYLMNDSQVMASSQDKVLHQNAYLLFYLEQQPTAANPDVRPATASAAEGQPTTPRPADKSPLVAKNSNTPTMIGPKLPSMASPKPAVIGEPVKNSKIKFLNGFKQGDAAAAAAASAASATPLKAEPTSTLNQSSIGTHGNIFQNFGNTTNRGLLPQQREKVSFGLSTPTATPSSSSSSSSKAVESTAKSPSPVMKAVDDDVVSNPEPPSLNSPQPPPSTTTLPSAASQLPSQQQQSPKITMKIKGNKVVYNSALDASAAETPSSSSSSSSPLKTKAPPLVQPERVKPLPSLVPYEEDSSSSADDSTKKSSSSKIKAETIYNPAKVEKVEGKCSFGFREKDRPKTESLTHSDSVKSSANTLPTSSSSIAASKDDLLKVPLKPQQQHDAAAAEASTNSSSSPDNDVKTTTPGKWKISDDGAKSPVCGSESSHGSTNSTHSEWIVRENVVTPAGKSGTVTGTVPHHWSLVGDDEGRENTKCSEKKKSSSPPTSREGNLGHSQSNASSFVPRSLSPNLSSCDSYRESADGGSSADSSFKIRLKKTSLSESGNSQSPLAQRLQSGAVATEDRREKDRRRVQPRHYRRRDDENEEDGEKYTRERSDDRRSTHHRVSRESSASDHHSRSRQHSSSRNSSRYSSPSGKRPESQQHHHQHRSRRDSPRASRDLSRASRDLSRASRDSPKRASRDSSIGGRDSPRGSKDYASPRSSRKNSPHSPSRSRRNSRSPSSKRHHGEASRHRGEASSRHHGEASRHKVHVDHSRDDGVSARRSEEEERRRKRRPSSSSSSDDGSSESRRVEKKKKKVELSESTTQLIPSSQSASATDEEKSSKKKKKKKDKKKRKNKEKKKKEAEKYEWVEKTKESCVTKVKNNNGEKVKITEKKEHIVRHIPNATVVVVNTSGGQTSDSTPKDKVKKSTTENSASSAASSSSPTKPSYLSKPSSSPAKPFSFSSPEKPSSPIARTTAERVPTKIWDQPMFKNSSKDEDSAGKKTTTTTPTPSAASVESKDSVWDFLNKNRGIQGYGGKSVQGWNDQPGSGSRMEAGRKTMDDPNDSEDEEMDRGKVKKVKKKNPISSGFNNAFGLKSNPFQKQYENHNSKKFPSGGNG